MTQGRKICDALKDIRQRVADANGIFYAPTECNHKGECAGTCPVCEEELASLTKEIRQRRKLGMAASVVGLALGIGTLVSCNVIHPKGMVRGRVPAREKDTIQNVVTDSTENLAGDVPYLP